MTVSQISTSSLQQMLVSQLQAQDLTLSQLSAQLSSGKKYSDLTDYSPDDALNLLNLQNSSTQKQAYLGVMNTVQTRLSTYDTTMTDMESIVSQSQNLIAGNGNYDAGTASNISTLATNYLKSVGIDLNQQVDGRYIYAGSRYTTAPVTDPSTLTGSPSATIYTDNASLPAYDTGYGASAITMTTAGQTVTVGGTVGTPNNAAVTVNGKTYTYTVASGDTATNVAAGLAALVSADIPGTTSAGAVLTVGGTGTITNAAAAVTNTAAYAADSATIDSGYSVQYGVTSNNPAFQQLIAGLRFMQAAGNATDATTYKADMAQASTLMGSALISLQNVHSSVANNINTLTNETTAQNTAITSLSNQVDNIQQVDITQVSVEITALQTQLQASYTVTGDLEKLSLAQYL